MTALIASALLILPVVVAIRIARSPLFRTLAIVIDNWADTVPVDANRLS